MTSVSLEDIQYLIDKAKKITMTPDQVSEQRRSFAFGNTAFENPDITREIINAEARKIGL
jgi:hypothetical protein